MKKEDILYDNGIITLRSLTNYLNKLVKRYPDYVVGTNVCDNITTGICEFSNFIEVKVSKIKKTITLD